MNLKQKFEILTYNIGFVDKKINKVLQNGIGNGDIIWLKHKYRDRFFADPFLLRQDESFYYILCEELKFWDEKGVIVCLKVDKETKTLVDRKIIIEEAYHLSFPFCEENGEWVVPEACKSGKTIAYKVDRHTLEIKEKKQILGEGLVDNVFYKNAEGKIWIYTGKTIIPSTELYEYYLDEYGCFRSRQNTPIISDNRTTRGAGRFFINQGKLYRPVQDCKQRYGHQTKIMEIISVGEPGYEAREICTFNSFSNPPYNETMHTFNVYDDVIIIDGSKDELRFPMKLFYKKAKWLFRGREK